MTRLASIASGVALALLAINVTGLAQSQARPQTPSQPAMVLVPDRAGARRDCASATPATAGARQIQTSAARILWLIGR